MPGGRCSSFTLLLDGTVLVAGGVDCQRRRCGVFRDGRGGAVRPCRRVAAACQPSRARLRPVFPSPTPIPTPLPPAAGPVPPNARSWKVTVDNKSSEPATLFVAEEDESGMLRLVGSATPNVVPAGATVKVTFRFPAKGGRRMDLREPATGRRGIVGQRGRHRHPRQDPDHSGRPRGLVEPVAGKPRAERLRRLACARACRWLPTGPAEPFFDSALLSLWRPRTASGNGRHSDDPLAWYARSA